MWWAFVTITTVGYGGDVPVTVAGRFVAVGLMVEGVAVLGIIMATLSSWVIERVARGREAESATRRQGRERSELVDVLPGRLGDAPLAADKV